MKIITVDQINKNPFTLLSKDWSILAAKNSDGEFNGMTVSWGGFGVLWNKNVVSVYIRPQRHTKQFVDDQGYFTLNFFDESYRDALKFYGSKSGKDVNKEEACNLHVEDNAYNAHIKEASMVLVCKKLYQDKIKPEMMLDANIDEKNYPQKDYHDVYIAEVVQVLVKE